MEIKKTGKKSSTYSGNVVISGNTVEYTQYSNLSNSIKWRKLHNNLYVNIETGEYKKKNLSDIKKYKNTNLNSLRHTIKYIRRVINCNFFGDDNERFLTLTYADNMQDTKQLYLDVNKFIKRLKYHLRDNNLKYINIIEPQGRGAWHCHILVKSNKIWLLSDNMLFDLWGKGITFQTNLCNIDNVGAYLSSYLTNTKEKKKQRLYMYPQNVKIMRCSKNIEKPKIIKEVSPVIFEKEFKDLNLLYIDSYDFVNNDKICNSILYRSYKRKVL